MLRADLKTADIPYRDENNRVADFHALRHTFVTNLVSGGVHPKVAQTLARHSTITLTMDRYSHTHHNQLSQALSALPDLPTATPNPANLPTRMRRIPAMLPVRKPPPTGRLTGRSLDDQQRLTGTR